MSELEISWREVEAGMRLELPGGTYVVGKVVKVTLSGKAGTFTRELKAKSLVTVARKLPLHDARGQMSRWAANAEHDKVLPPEIEKGDPAATRPPSKAKGGAWDKPADKAEKSILKGLPGASLVGATGDASLGWYVPELDPSTIAAHLYLFHDIEAAAATFEELWAMHEAHHARALVAPFTSLHVNHWHTKERPAL
jgi:hypothetical protein